MNKIRKFSISGFHLGFWPTVFYLATYQHYGLETAIISVLLYVALSILK